MSDTRDVFDSILSAPSVSTEMVSKYLDQKSIKCGACTEGMVAPVAKSVVDGTALSKEAYVTDVSLSQPMLLSEMPAPSFFAVVTGCINCGHIQLFNLNHVLAESKEAEGE